MNPTVIHPLLALPFALLLLMVATGPVLYPRFWHAYYPYIVPTLGAGVIGYYIGVRGDTVKPIEALAEYVQFISFIAALYMASSGMLIKVQYQATPRVNGLLLLIGAILSNVIGTTGASMLLIRPFIRLNKQHIQPYHVVFFIFIVSNVGGALTPIGDPPLFLGFLKGVPFWWTIQHNFLPWLTGVMVLCLLFYGLDSRHTGKLVTKRIQHLSKAQGVEVKGKSALLWLSMVVMVIFLDPNLISWVPAISYHGHSFSFVREIVLCGIAFASYYYADPKVLQENGFSLEPIKEVMIVFLGIFSTMIPALTLVGEFASSEVGKSLLTPDMLYWGTGICSSILDNAPTYLNFLAAGMSAQGLTIESIAEVGQYAKEAIHHLGATGTAAVFFGGMTYIGNGPNFMVKSIAEHQGVSMPSFGGYVLRYALPFLLPVLFLVWVIFFFNS